MKIAWSLALFALSWASGCAQLRFATISCDHGTLHIDPEVEESLVETTFSCVDSVGGPLQQRAIGVYTTAQEAQQILASLIYQPDANYHATPAGDEFFGALQLSQTSCSAVTPHETSLYPSPAVSVHEKKISISSVNDAPSIDRTSGSTLAVHAAGSCVGLTGFQLSDVEAMAMENDPSALTPILTLQLGIENGSLRVNRRTALHHGVRMVGGAGSNTGDVALAWTLPDLVDSSLVLNGGISGLNSLLPAIEYCSSSNSNVASSDALRVTLSDNGFCGGAAKQSLSASLSVAVRILPIADLGSLAATGENVTLTSLSAEVNVQYLPGEVDEMDCTIELQHDDRMLLAVDDQLNLLLVGRDAPTAATQIFRRDLSTPAKALIVTFEDNATAYSHQTSSFKMVRNVCGVADSCHARESSLLHEDSSDMEVVAAARTLAADEENVAELQVTRYPASREWLIWNVPETLFHGLEISTRFQISMRKAGQRLHLRGKREQIAALLNTLRIYSLAGDAWGYNRLSITMGAVGAAAARPQDELSIQLDVFAVPTYENIEMTYCVDLVVGESREASLGAISLNYPLTYAASATLKWGIRTTFGTIWWDPGSISPAVVGRQISRTEFEFRGNLEDLNAAIASIRIDENAVQEDKSLFDSFYEDQVFELLALPHAKATSTQTLTTSLADGAISGVFSLGAELPGRNYPGLGLNITNGKCVSDPIKSSDDVETMATKLTHMPCTVVPAGALGDISRHEIQSIRVAALYPAKIDELEGTFQVTFQGKSSDPISVAASSDMLKLGILQVVVDGQDVGVSRHELSGGNAFEWQITFGAIDDIEEVFGIIDDGLSAPFEVSVAVIQDGLGPNSLRLNTFFPGLLLSVQELKSADTGSLVLDFSFSNTAEDLPVMSVVASTLASTQTAEPVAVAVRESTATVSSGLPAVFQLRVQGQVTSPLYLSAKADTVERALRQLGIEKLAVTVERRPSPSVLGRFDYVVVMSAPTVLALELVAGVDAPLSTAFFRASFINPGVENLVAFDNISMSLTTLDNLTLIASGALRARTSMREHKLGIGLPASYLRVVSNQSLMIGTIGFHGYAHEVKLTVSCAKGTIGLLPNLPRPGDPIVPQPVLELTGPLSALEASFERSRLVYSPNDGASGHDELVFRLESIADQATESIPIEISSPASPPRMALPLEPIIVFKHTYADINGVVISLDPGDSSQQASRSRAVGVHITAQSGHLELTSDVDSDDSQSKSELRLEGATENVNAILKGLRYRALTPSVPADDHIVFSTYLVGGSDASSAPDTSTLSVKIIERPLAIGILVNSSSIGDSSLLSTKKNAPASLGAVSIRVKDDTDARDCENLPSCNVTVELSLFAVHGSIFDRGDGSQKNVPAAPGPHLLLARFTGSAKQANRYLQRQMYVPNDQFYGPDQIMIKVKHTTSTTQGHDVEGEVTALLPVFVSPDCEPPRLYWTDDSSNTMSTTSSTRLPFVIPDLMLVREGLEVGFCRDDVIFRVVLQANRGFLSSEPTPVIANPAPVIAQSTVVLEGWINDLNLALKAVKYQFELQRTSQPPVKVAIDIRVEENATPGGNVLDAISSARLYLSFVGNSAPPDLLVQRAIVSSEDEDVLIGKLLNLEAVADLGADTTLDIAAHNGAIYAVAGGVHEKPSFTQHISLKDANLLRLLVSQLRYVPKLNFNGIDQVDFKVRDQESTLYINVRPLNDPPQLKFNLEEMRDWHSYPRLFLPSFQIDDPDENDQFQVDIRIDTGALRVIQLAGAEFDGTTVELSPSMSSVRMISTLDRLNKIFLQRLIEVLPASCRESSSILNYCAAVIEVCVGDGTARVCDELHMPVQDPFYRITVSDWARKLNVTAGHALSVSTAFTVHEKFEARNLLALRIYVSAGFLQIEMPSCGDLRDVLQSKSNGMTQMIYAPDVACLNAALASVHYQSAGGMHNATLIQLELFSEEMRFQANGTIHVEIVERSPPKLLSATKILKDDVWYAKQDSYADLSSLVAASISDLSGQEAEELSKDGILELNVSCIGCQWNYDVFVPSVSYEFAQLPSSKLSFLGLGRSLNKVLASLQLVVDSNPASGTETISLEVAQPSPDSRQEAQLGWREVANISIPFVIQSAPLRWKTQQNSFVARLAAYSTALSGVELVGREDSSHLNVTIRLQCVFGRATVNVLQARPPILKAPCNPGEDALEFVATRAEANNILSSTLVSMDLRERGARTDLRLSAMEAVSERASEPVITDLHFHTSSQVPYTVLTPKAPDLVIQANEDESQRVGDILTVDGDPEDETWFMVKASVGHGRLSIPANICCVDVRETLRESDLVVVGTALSLKKALAAAECLSEPYFSGEDWLEIHIQPYHSESGASGVSFKVPIIVSGVNHSPTISYQQHRTLDSSVVFSEQRIEIRDVDVSNLDGLVAVPFLTDLSSVSGSFLLDENAKQRVSVLGFRKSDAGYTNFTFEASLTDTNLLLARVLYASNAVTPDCSTDEEIFVAVSDQGHGVAAWSSQQAVATVTISGCDQFQLELSAAGAMLNPMTSGEVVPMLQLEMEGIYDMPAFLIRRNSTDSVLEVEAGHVLSLDEFQLHDHDLRASTLWLSLSISTDNGALSRTNRTVDSNSPTQRILWVNGTTDQINAQLSHVTYSADPQASRFDKLGFTIVVDELVQSVSDFVVVIMETAVLPLIHVDGMESLNAALQSLRYRCDETCDQSDMITFTVRNQYATPTEFTHQRQISIQLITDVPLPRVILSASLYSGAEDAAFQFPDISLRFDDAHVQASHKEVVASKAKQSPQLWAVELSYPATKYAYPRATSDDWRHRLVASFTGGSVPRFLCTVGNLFYFRGSDELHGEELWESDGSTVGTRRLTDLAPGPEGSSPTDLVVLNGKLFFTASGIDVGWSLASATQCNSMRVSTTNSSLLYVVAESNTWNPVKSYDCPFGSYWASTDEASEYLSTHEATSEAESYVFWDTCDWKGYSFGGVSRKYFRFSDSSFTGALKHAGRLDSAPAEVSFVTTEFAGIVCIRSETDTAVRGAGREMWATDGSVELTRRVVDIRPGPQGSNPRYYTPFQSQLLLFQAETNAFGTELFKTDGTEAGTVMVEDIWHGPRSSNPSYFAEWTAVDGRARMYFAATAESGRELWATDAFSSFNSDRNRKVASSSGLVGTFMVLDVCAGSKSSEPRFLVAAVAVGVFFSATDCIHGRELWLTDGSSPGTRMVKDLDTTTGRGSDPSHLVVFGGKVYFQAQADPSIGRELYVSDGSTAGTVLLVDLVPGSFSSSPSLMSVVGPITAADGSTKNNELFFSAFDSSGSRNLWKSDGTAAGTIPILDQIFLLNHKLPFGTAESNDRSERMFQFGNTVYFPTAELSTGRATASDPESASYTLEVAVSSGAIAIPQTEGGTNDGKAQSTAKLKLQDSYKGLARALDRLVYFPPQNWNEEQFPGGHIVEWNFSVSFENRSVETYADLVITPRVDAPVITVPQMLEEPTRYMGDYLSLWRLECLPMICDEDSPMTLEGFSVRTVDVTHSQLSTSDLLTASLAVSHGVLSLGDTSSANCIRQYVGPQSVKHISFKAGVECINRVLTATTYIGEPNFSGTDQLTLQVAYSKGPPSASDEVVVSIIVMELNDAPYVDVPSVYYTADEDVPLVIEDLQLRDPDAEQDSLRLTIEAAYGHLALLRSTGIALTTATVTRNTGEATRLTLVGSLEELNAAISSVVYTSAKDWNSLQYHPSDGDNGAVENDGFDTITIEATDFSIFNGSTASVLYVYVSPTPDLVVIDLPSNVETSVYANDPAGTLRGDEDSWILARGLQFSSADDTSQTTLLASLSVMHGTILLSHLAGLTFLEKTGNDAKRVKVKGTFANVNECVAGLRYLPDPDFFGRDSLIVDANAVDEYTQQHTPTTSISVDITVDPINDAPMWTVGSSTTREVQQGLPTNVAGVSFEDVDLVGLDCAVASCQMDLILEASHGFVTLPRLSSLAFSGDTNSKKSSYAVVSGTPEELNVVLSELIFELDAPEYYRADELSRTDIKLQLTIDDRGTFGRGGPQLSSTTVLFNPVLWAPHELLVVTPDEVLALDEDTAYVFDGGLQLVDPDSTRSFQNLLEVTIVCTNGTFALSAVATGVQVLRNSSSGDIVIHGFFEQLNAALNGSAYIPNADWFGPEQVSISAAEFNPHYRTKEVAVATVFLFVSPVCDEPHWENLQHVDKQLTMDEDAYLLVDTLSLTNPDLDDEQREVEVKIDVKHGGIMLSTMKGLLIRRTAYSTPAEALEAQHVPPGQIYLESRLFFAELVFRGRVSDVNAALDGMIYKPWLNYNSDGWPVDEILLVATSACGDTANNSRRPAAYTSVATIPIAVCAVNDPPILLSQHFQPIPTSYTLQDLGVVAMISSIEAVEDSPQQLEAIELFDPDCELNGADLRLVVNISCVHCTITSGRIPQSVVSSENEQQIGDDLIVVTRNWMKEEGVQLVVHGRISSLNQGLMNQLVFQGMSNFNGLAVVLLEISDLGNYGKGGVLHTMYALPVRVKAVSDIPQIYLPPFESQEPLIQINENASVLIQGSPALSTIAAASREQHQALPKWDLMAANLLGNDSSARLRSLHQFVGSDAASTSFLVAHTGGLLFSGWDPSLGQELWHSDGSEAGTVLLKDVFPGPGGSRPSHLTPFSKDNRVYFAAKGPHISWQIKSDYQDECQSFRSSSFDPNVFFAVAAQNVWDPDEVSTMYADSRSATAILSCSYLLIAHFQTCYAYQTYDCPLGFRWMSTLEAHAVFMGTLPLDGHDDEPLTYFDQCGWQGFEWGGQVRKYFRFSDSKKLKLTRTFTYALTQTTGAFKHVGFRDSYRLDTGFQTDLFAGVVCYWQPAAQEATWGTQLWATDGTAEGTQRVAQISTNPEGSNPSHFVELNARLYFQASSTDFGAELWTTDGTREGTFLVADVEFGSRSSAPCFLTAFDGRIFFSADTQAVGRELWFSDGNSRFEFAGDQHAIVGTGLLLDICAGVGSSLPQNFAVLIPSTGPPLLLFQANDCMHGAELWVTDGTRAGTFLVLDIRQGVLGSSPTYLVPFAGRIYFQADDGVHGAELWTTDGSAAGTSMLVDLAPGVSGSKPSFLTVLNSIDAPSDVLVFAAQVERDRLVEFWRSDGTSVGTTKLFPWSHEVVEMNADSMNYQLAGHALASVASQPAGFFYLGRESGQGLDFHYLAADRSTATSSQGSYSTRSITLVDVEAMQQKRELTLSLNCSKGWLSLGRECSGVAISQRGDISEGRSAVLTLEGTMDALNCAVEKVTYHSKPQADGRDEIIVSLAQSQQRSSSEDATAANSDDNAGEDSSYLVTKRMLVDIRAINDPPVIHMAAQYFAPSRQWVAFAGIEIADPDAAEGILYLSIAVHNGRLRAILPQHSQGRSATVLCTTVDGDAAHTLEFATTLMQAKQVFEALEYSCDGRHGCVAGQRDYLTVQVDDNGFTGARGPQVAAKTAEIIVLTDTA
ncbi:hypothetical protein BBJ28_00006860 [Nothophytophthora sp. Chile5]|nr:hypothetical protein BBJ28_00006860 [Nothophytophthora sp. Chile5]